MVLLILTFTAMMLGCGARLTLTPDNVAVLQGTKVTLKCSSDSSKTLLWRVMWNSSVGIRTIYTGIKLAVNFSSLYSISTINTGEVNLIVRASEATALTYFCEEPGASNSSAELIVLASDPTCDKENRANDVGAMEPRIQLTCRLKYWGNWAPIMEWKRVPIGWSDDKNPPRLKAGVVSKSGNYSVESTLDISKDSGARYVFITRFTQSQRSRPTGANNIPIYSYKWEYPVQDETGGNATVSTVVTFLVILVFITFAMAAYIVYTKRKQPNNQSDTREIDALEELRRTHSWWSGYAEIGPSSNMPIVGEAHYIGRNEEGSPKANVDEENQDLDCNTKPNTPGFYACVQICTSPTDHKQAVREKSVSVTKKYLEVIL